MLALFQFEIANYRLSLTSVILRCRVKKAALLAESGGVCGASRVSGVSGVSKDPAPNSANMRAARLTMLTPLTTLTPLLFPSPRVLRLLLHERYPEPKLRSMSRSAGRFDRSSMRQQYGARNRQPHS